MTAARADALPDIGVLFFGTDTSYPLLDVADAIQERGFDSIVLPEHTHMPLAAAAAYPVGDLPERYKRVLDPYIGLAMVAARTDLKLGTCISLIAQHDPIALAKAIATLDHLSGGRFTLGVGYGWNQAELENHGPKFSQRRAIARENIAVMRTLWRDEEAEFSGEHVHLSPSWVWPKPAQGPTVPVLLGVVPTERGFADIIANADGWIPGGDDLDLMAGWFTTLREQWHAAGRAESGPIIWPMVGVVDDDTLRRKLDRFRTLGASQVLLDFQAVSREETLPTLDRYAKVVAEYRS
jgi:probable F420-dependent oxidoreductase